MQILKLVIFPRVKELIIKRNEKFGGEIKIGNYEELEKIYSQGKLHPMDLKNSVSEELEKIIKPIREKI